MFQFKLFVFIYLQVKIIIINLDAKIKIISSNFFNYSIVRIIVWLCCNFLMNFSNFTNFKFYNLI